MPDDETTPAEEPQDAAAPSGDESPGEDAPESDASVEEALDEAKATVDDTQAVVDDAATEAMSDAPDAPSEAPGTFSMPEFGEGGSAGAAAAIELLSDVNLNVKIELGRTRLLVEDVLKLGEGAVVELDKLAGDPVDIFVNDRHVARGEVLVLNDNFCIRVSEILDGIGEAASEASGAV